MGLKSDNDISILFEQIAQGSENAFRQLFDLYYQKLFHVALYFLKSKESAEEAVCDVFYFIWNKKETLCKIKEWEGYLYISVKNQALQYMRRTSLSEGDTIDLYHIALLPDSDDPEANLLDHEFTELIQKAINSLPEKCREVFRLVFFDKLKHKEIAKLLDISEKTVEAHIASAYKRIAQYVNNEYSDKGKGNKMLFIFFSLLG
ncbi:RNA polymerase sigma-70 factor [Parabacteroides pacaensis]|uniref:RNA polymerase sigma-70 factor n=1 Tax=Parabacteroides pacaensis TaxID=2086575 RepID=UPI000D0FD342|nr:RNA polymerase sigma-70 factor [Parabacteroides pacaensis]